VGADVVEGLLIITMGETEDSITLFEVAGWGEGVEVGNEAVIDASTLIKEVWRGKEVGEATSVFTLAVSTGVEVGKGMAVGNVAVIVVAFVVFNVIGAGVVRAGVVIKAFVGAEVSLEVVGAKVVRAGVMLEVFAGAVVVIEVFIDAWTLIEEVWRGKEVEEVDSMLTLAASTGVEVGKVCWGTMMLDGVLAVLSSPVV